MTYVSKIMDQFPVFDDGLTEYLPFQHPTIQKLQKNEKHPEHESQLDADWWVVDKFSHDVSLAAHLEDDRSTDVSSTAFFRNSSTSSPSNALNENDVNENLDNLHDDNLLAGRVERVEVRVERPLENMIKLFETKNYDPIIAQHKKWFKNMTDEPLKFYRNMRNKLDREGETASFREEFEGSVALLTKKLFQEERCAAWFRHASQKYEREQLIASLAGIQIETRYMFPYRRTIEVIRTMLSIIDVYYRKHVKDDLVPYYHNFRYDYYMTLLTDVSRNDIVLLPTVAYVGSTALLKMRAAPIHVLGVVDKPTYADQYLNSPLDFFAHDVNHARRTMLENERYYDTFVKHRNYYTTRNYWTNVSLPQWYDEMDQFTKECVLPMITVDAKKDAEEVVAKKALKRILAFEITHEKAWPITPASILRNIVQGYDAFPVESLVADGGVIRTKDFTFSDPTTLANCIGKLRGGFYDNANDPNHKIVPANARTAKQLAAAALEMYVEIKEKYYSTGVDANSVDNNSGNICDNNSGNICVLKSLETPSLQFLEALATDPHDTTEFRDTATIVIPDDPRVPYPKDGAFRKPRPEEFIEGWDENF